MAALPSAAALAARCVHIKVYPTPRSLLERRQVLRVLERFGDVDVFRNLKYDTAQPVPNAFHSIFRAPSSATAAIAASPLRYTLVSEALSPAATSTAQSQISLQNASHLEAISTGEPSVDSKTNPESQTEAHSEAQNEKLPPQENIYELRISSSTYPHLDAVARTPLHGPYSPISASRSVIAADLLNRLPPNAARQGLADWVTGGLTPEAGMGMGMRVVIGKEPQVAGKATRWYDSKVPWRVRDRMRAGNGADGGVGTVRRRTDDRKADE